MVLIQVSYPKQVSGIYNSHPPRKNRNGDRGSGDPQGNGKPYPHSSGGGCSGTHGIPGGGDGGMPDDPYGGGSHSPSFSEFGRQCRHDQHTHQHEQFEQSMSVMNNSLIDLLWCQQRMQNDITRTFQVIHQSK